MRDFVDPSVTSLFNPRRPGVDDHGMYVLQMLGGSNKKENIQYGMATGASFYLARTDDATMESRQEEDYWISALEWMDSLGVRLVNSSLGYSHYFDKAEENYKVTDMNGSTSLVAKAAQLAVDKKGMIIVSSIGNEGKDSTWQVLTTPSDAAGVISVGAADIDYWFKPSFSSIGPSFLSYLKPNIACPTADGTSFSAPFITGLIACMLERNPNLTNKQVKDIIEKSGHLYPYGNNFIGYGLPDANRVLKLLENPGVNFNRAEEILATGDSIVLYLDKYREKPGEILTFFFKKDKYTVNLQAISEDNRFVLRRRKNTPRVTIASRSKVLEVIWQ
jgi:subtilisin family serine protease